MTASSELYTCPACARSNAADAMFCVGCASPLVCTGCKTRLTGSASFCSHCGRPAGRRPDRSRYEPSSNRPIGRRVETSANFRIQVQIDSFADRQAAGVAQRLETLVGALGEILGLVQPERPIGIYLSEVLQDPQEPGSTVTTGSYAVPERREVWCIFRSDAPGVDLERTVVRLLLAIRTGRDPVRAAMLVDGVVGLAGQRLGFVLPADQLNQLLSDALAAGAPVSVQPLIGGPTAETMHFYPPVATAFAGYLLELKGAQAFLGLVEQFDPLQPDSAFRAVYGQPLATLEKRWLQRLRKHAPRVGGIGRFLKASMSYLRPYRGKQAEILLYIMFGIAFSQAMPHAQRYLIDSVLPKGQTRTLFLVLGLGIGLFFILAATSLRQALLNAQVGEGVMRDLRSQLFTHLQYLSASFYSTTSSGDILSRMSNDLFAVEFGLTQAILQGVILVLTFFASLGSLLYLDWKLTLMAAAVLPAFYLITRFLGPPAAQASLQRQQVLADVTGVLQENIAAQPVVRAYNLRGTFIREYTVQLGNLYRSAIRVVFLGSLYGTSASMLNTLIAVLAFGIGGYFVIQGQLSLGALVAFLGLLGGLTAPAQSISGVAQALQQASGAMERITGLLNEQPKVADQPDARPMAPLARAIRFDQVWFSYTGAEPQISDLTLTVPAGSAVAFVGPSGSGKSTVTNLILRIYDADHGSLTFDGIDVRNLAIDSMRSQIGIVFQDNFLFNRSIRENIRFGRENASDQEVEDAARAAEVHDFIVQMPQGYNTVTGERGANLSGGQRQRIAIARAILRNPSILILDEATSALDPRTENAINHTLAALAKGRTTITITHRLAAASTADIIFVLDRGRLVEQGTHGDLLQAGGLYDHLYEEQSGAVSGGVLQLEYLRRVPIFTALSGDVLSGLASRLTTERFESGTAIVTQGEPGEKLYLVVSGEVEVFAHDAAGHERSLAVLRTGDFFGEIALLYDVPRTATVRARTSTTVYALDRDSLLRMLESVPGLRQTIEAAISVRQQARGAEAAETLAWPDTTDLADVIIEGVEPAAPAMTFAPWARQKPMLTIIEGDDAGRLFTLNEEFTGIGRHPANDIVLLDQRVSGYHARVERTRDDRYLITDSGSSNGTRLNGEPMLRPALLNPGDTLGVGSTLLRFDVGA